MIDTEGKDIRIFLTDFVRRENRLGAFAVEEENVARIVDILLYLDIEAYRPLTKLLLQNWQSIVQRVDAFDEARWQAVRTGDSGGALDEVTMAILAEILEGEDTDAQTAVFEGYLPAE